MLRARLLLFLLALTLGLPLGLRADSTTHALPDMKRQMQVWLGDAHAPFVVSGCLPVVPAASLTLAAFACDIYVRDTTTNELLYASQATRAVGPLSGGNGTYWLAVHRDTSTAVAGWTRQAGARYLWQLSATQPAQPAGGRIVTEVTVNGGSITAVIDKRIRIITSAVTETASLTTSADSVWIFAPGGSLCPANGVTLTHGGTVHAAPHQPIFCTSTTGLVVLSQVSRVYAGWWGVTCNGITEDTTGFTRALAQNTILEMQPGTCLLDTTTLTSASVAIVHGSGIGKTVLFHKANATADLFNGPAVGASVPYIELQHLTVDGNHANQTDWERNVFSVRADTVFIAHTEWKKCKRSCVNFPQINRVAWVQDNWFHDMAQHGGVAGQDTMTVLVQKENITGNNAYSVVYFQNNKVEMTTQPVGDGNSVGGFFVSVTDGFPQRVIVTSNTFIFMGQDIAGNIISPIECYRECDNSLFANNVVNFAYTQPIKVQRSTNIVIEHNIISGQGANIPLGSYAINISNRAPTTAEQRILIQGNLVRNVASADACIYVVYNAGAQLSDISIIDNTCDTLNGGIYISEANGSIKIRGNLIKNITGTTDFKMSCIAFLNVPAANIDISHNTCDTVQRIGIHYDDSSLQTVSLSVTDNVFRDVGLSLVGGATGQLILRDVTTLHLHGNTWIDADASMPGSLRRFDIANITNVTMTDNVTPASPVLTYGASAGTATFKNIGNTWSNDAGSVTLDGATPTTVTLGTAENDATYRVTVTCNANETSVWVTTRTTTTFLIQSAGAHTAVCDWQLAR